MDGGGAFGANYDDEEEEEQEEEEESEEEEEKEEGSEDEEEDEGQSTRWKENLSRRAADAYLEREKGFSTFNLMELVYGKGGREEGREDEEEEEEEEEEEDFFRPRRSDKKKDEFGCPLDGLDSSRLALGGVKVRREGGRAGWRAG